MDGRQTVAAYLNSVDTLHILQRVTSVPTDTETKENINKRWNNTKVIQPNYQRNSSISKSNSKEDKSKSIENRILENRIKINDHIDRNLSYEDVYNLITEKNINITIQCLLFFNEEHIITFQFVLMYFDIIFT